MHDGTQTDTAQPSSHYHDTNSESHDSLIAHQTNTAIDHDTDTDSLLRDESTSQNHPIPSSNRRQIYLLTLTAGLSGLLFGYDTGIISSTLINLHLSLGRPLSITDESLITSSTSLLALLASPFAGLVADSLGRKPLIAATCVLFIAGALVQAFAGAVWVMVLGRGIVGLAIGAASGVVPVYIGEIAPARSRGRLVTVQALLITGGQVVAYCVGAAVMGRWRVAVGVGALPALVQAVLLLGLPESPRWLVLRGREDQARRVLARLGEDVESVLGRIKEEVKEEEIRRAKSVWSELLLVPGHRRALTIACMLQGLQQLCGFNVLMYFSATIFTLVGFTTPIIISLSIAVTNFIFTLFAFSLIDSIGRRRILLLSIPFMILALALSAICFSHLPNDSGASLATPYRATLKHTLVPYALLLSLILYVAAYALGLGCVPWQQGELFPLSVRSLGSGLATATNWGGNFVVGISFLPMMQVLGSEVTFAGYAIVCAIGWVLVWLIYPETKGLELEDVGRLLDQGWGVRDRKGLRDRSGMVRVPDEETDEG